MKLLSETLCINSFVFENKCNILKGYFSTKEGVNIIAFDYNEISFWNINYFLAAANIKNLGQFVGDILKKILILDLQVDQEKEYTPAYH